MSQEELISLLSTLISFPSTKENEKGREDVLSFVQNYLSDSPVKSYVSHGVKSLLFSNTDTVPDKFKIILNGHLDVVPGTDEQYHPVVKNGKVFGRGAQDMKGGAAVEILLFKELAKTLPYPIGLQLVTDEEIGGFDGAKYQMEQGVTAEFVLAGEPTDFGINTKSKGIVWMEIIAHGKSSHGAHLWEGDNAIWKMATFLDRLKTVYPVPDKEVWATTVNVASIESTNQTINKVPDDCHVQLDIRYIPEDRDTIVSKIGGLLPEGVTHEVKVQEPAHDTPDTDSHIKKLQEITSTILGKPCLLVDQHGGSDVRHFAEKGISAVTFGPVGSGMHTDEEWVDLASLEQFYLILRQFLRALQE